MSDVLAQVISAYKKSSLGADSYLNALFSELELQSAGLSAAIKRLTAQSNLKTKDEVRGKATRALFFVVRGAAYHPEPSISQAGLSLQRVLDNHGLNLVHASYATASALLNSLINDLAAAHLQASIAAISGCAERIAQVQAAQADFESARLAFESSKAEERQLPCASTIKNEVLKNINTRLVGYLKGMQLADQESYGSFARTVNQLIRDNNVIMKKRRASAQTNEPDALPVAEQEPGKLYHS